METTSATSTSSPTSSLTNSGSLAETFDNFLVLLTTQLENQDPLSPMDTNEFTRQLVDFTGVEQALQTNQLLEDLIAQQGESKFSDAANFVGKSVEAETLVTGLKDGSATMTYTLTGNAASTTITIVDDNGQTVRTLTGETSSGHHTLVWDGKNENGIDLPDGTYGFLVSAEDEEGAEVPAGQGTIGAVTAVEIVGEDLILNLGDLQVSLDSVIKIIAPDDESAGGSTSI